MHNASRRRRHPFLAVNCGALPETLLETEAPSGKIFSTVSVCYVSRYRRCESVLRTATSSSPRW
ncbi:sigma 54-interacting transcriptional regulator [Cupriavidus consociatus]|uniref:sigma 54-interacting transcriptional regulator n=1 Tax=Cupriavidus consociatus TaxID=2821357 RepID=UPI001AE912A4|nr:MULTISPECIES: sigma 54-interacting transcriptional regulator [unclassified Cupriavidus]MBP0624995.1 sigma 54-interacting transcriptional regulator [Cupriavidus sp. LEh25]MDK2661727.1 sigma 54-interacting transcriptional regulator [Cupriavidus sp. LEh21]